MICSFQFDECYNDPEVIAACNKYEDSVALEYPLDLQGCEDDEMLPLLMAADNPLVTTDHLIVDKYRKFIPECNPGIIIIRYRRMTKTMTHQDASRLIAKFKKYYPNWRGADWKGVRLDITETEVFVSSVHDETYQSMTKLQYTAEFANEFDRAISQIARHLSNLITDKPTG